LSEVQPQSSHLPGSSTVAQFCARHNLSRSTFYVLLGTGKGPRVMRIGRRVLISDQADADWVVEREAEAARGDR
jgi:predicted DNA-binding transcriptional regulator AlpA